MNNNHRMTRVSDVTEIFNYLPNDHSCSSIYINIENIINLIALSPVLYNNIPLLRTHMISKTKTYDLNSQKYNLLDRILEKNSSIQNHKLFLITDDEETKKYINDNSVSKLTILNQHEAQNMLNVDDNSILILDINDKLLISNRNDKPVNHTESTRCIHFLIFELL